MSWRHLETVHGIAIDNPETAIHHQIASVNKRHNTVNYTIFYAPYLGSMKCPDDVASRFIETMQTSALPRTQKECDHLTREYSILMNTIRPPSCSEAFQRRTECKAMTFDIVYDDNFMPQGLTYRPSIGIMDSIMTYDDAQKGMKKNKDLRILYEIARHLVPARKFNDNIPYEDVISCLSRYIAREKLKQDFLNEKIDTIFRVPPLQPDIDDIRRYQTLSPEEWAIENARYHSLKVHMEENGDDIDAIPAESDEPITAGRNDVAHFNIAQSAESILKGKSPFPEDTAESITLYKRHMLFWQRLNGGKIALA